MIEIKKCILEDAALLAEMNKQLIEDEKAGNPMDISQLKSRMIDFLQNGCKAYLIISGKKVVGYALIDMTKEPKYLRQFFVVREERRKHYGERAIAKLLEKLDIKELDIDVLKWNETGIKFWEAMGFKELWKRMRYEI